MYAKRARFSDMRPARVDSNVYSYHLRVLQKDGLVEKTPKGYRLTPAGLLYVDKVSMENLEPRLQPKIITMIVAQNEQNEVLLVPKTKQPFIDALMVPFGKLHLDDATLLEAAQRELREKVKVTGASLRHVGDCYIRAHINGGLVWNVLAHVFVTKLAADQVGLANAVWHDVLLGDVSDYIPAAQQVITKALTAQSFFFEEFNVDW
jgi:8-oxo-dGTP pyrophosphatase MutT (NUDIX family)